MSQPHPEIADGKGSWWRRWLLKPVMAQLTQGISADRLAWTIALGVVFGVFPIMGSTTLVCLLVGYLFRLNQPVLHVFKTAAYPLHLALILVFIHLGERLFGVPSLPFSIPELLSKFKEDPLQFARDFGMAAFHGVVAWAVIAPVAAMLIKVSVMPMLIRFQNSLKSKREVLP